MENDFAHVSSLLKNHFAFGNELQQKVKIDSIIPGKRVFRPSEVEVWAFNLKHQNWLRESFFISLISSKM